ncbi:ArnT family glycosyltransferase [Streptomyces sp. NPDC001401]|uniref:ArnT family glycosyltransferase n=1 Tax=Streptomyces sp. NPDC001401 TaxID=3364570 RepID=UPI003681D36A
MMRQARALRTSTAMLVHGLTDTAGRPAVRVPTGTSTRAGPGPRRNRPGVPDLRGLVLRRLSAAAPLTAVLVLAGLMRFWALGATGFNSDEAVYTGTAASLAGDPTLQQFFPVFRAHPLLLATVLSGLLGRGIDDFSARAVTAAIGVACVALTYLLAKRLYGRGAGLAAALLLAVMPYHVIVSRQVLLDGLLTLCATGVLYCVVRYVESTSLPWLLAAGAAMGATVLAKETGMVFLGALYGFFALTKGVPVRLRHLVYALATMTAVAAAFPLAVYLAGSHRTGQNYVLWQLFRRANHHPWFYLVNVPGAVGWAVLVAAAAGLVWLRRQGTWREPLLLWWIAVPVLFFDLWPVKGYQYLLPIAPVLAVLAGRTLAAVAGLRLPGRWPAHAASVVSVGLCLAVAASLAGPAAARIDPAPTGKLLAGTGGLPGGREAGLWVRTHVPQGARMLAAGPSLANVLQFYGHRQVSALSVTGGALYHNPAYQPVRNPDRALRTGQYQYVVWDSYTAARSSFYGDKARDLAAKYHGITVYTGVENVRTGPGGAHADRKTIVIYKVRAS